MLVALKSRLKKVLPDAAYQFLRVFRLKDLSACTSFLCDAGLGLPFIGRAGLLARLYAVSFAVESPHTQDEILEYVKTILSLPRDRAGRIVEAGCFKGSSTAKFSLAAELADKELVVFDSFRGIPRNEEPQDRGRVGGPARFKEGQYRGTREEVRANVARLGRIDRCRFIEGWFDDTMPAFLEPICAAYIDVDLAASTRTCLKYLYPLVVPGGVLFSQDGHLPLVVDVFDDDEFWLREVGCDKPRMAGLRQKKLVRIFKEGRPGPAPRHA
jgi:O-methyltransferase